MASVQCPLRFVPSSNHTLQPLLARGLLFSPDAEYGTGEYAFPNGLARSFPVFEGALPHDLAEQIEQVARNAYPVAIELTGDFTHQGPLRAVPIYAVAALVFRTEAERDRFLENAFGDSAPAAVLDVKVDPAAFTGEPRPPLAPMPQVPEQIPAERRVDSGLALLLCLGRIKGAKAPVAVNDADLIGPDIAEHLTSALHGEPAVSPEAEETYLRTAFDVLLEWPIQRGWSKRQVLRELHTRLSAQLAGPAQDDLEKIFRVFGKVLDEEIDVPPLTDNGGSLVSRAILLLLLRGSSERLDVPAHQEPQIGTRVRALALLLARTREGLRSLSREEKGFGEASENTLAALHAYGRAGYDLLEPTPSAPEPATEQATLDRLACGMQLASFEVTTDLTRPGCLKLAGPLAPGGVTLLLESNGLVRLVTVAWAKRLTKTTTPITPTPKVAQQLLEEAAQGPYQVTLRQDPPRIQVQCWSLPEPQAVLDAVTGLVAEANRIRPLFQKARARSKKSEN